MKTILNIVIFLTAELCLFSLVARAQCPSPTISPERTLLITDLSVVNDARAQGLGPWSFGGLLTRLTPPGRDPSELALAWLEQWLRPIAVGNRSVAPRPRMREILANWPRFSSGKIDLSRAPFRLLAIVNRMDALGPFTPEAAGEGRFVFALTDPRGAPLPLTVIFEYRLPLRIAPVRAWARRWHSLGQIPFGPDFNRALAALTESFARGPALNQLRTNEIALARPWEFREFRLRGDWLAPQPLAQNPDIEFNRPAAEGGRLEELVSWIDANRAAISEESFVLPDAWRAGSAPSPVTWAEPLKRTPESLTAARSVFALNTCAGCHTRETKTGFVHLSLRSYTENSRPSPFLRADLERRAQVLRRFLCGNSEGFRGSFRAH